MQISLKTSETHNNVFWPIFPEKDKLSDEFLLILELISLPPAILLFLSSSAKTWKVFVLVP